MVRRSLVAVALLGMLVMAAFALSPIYHGPLLLQLMAGAAAGSVGISVAARRLPGWQRGPAQCPGPGRGRRARHAGLRRRGRGRRRPAGDAGGAAQQHPPAAPRADPDRAAARTPVAPVIPTWLAGLAAAELAVRGRRVLLSYASDAAVRRGAVPRRAERTAGGWVPLAFAGCAALGLASTGVRQRVEPTSARPQRRTLRVRVGPARPPGWPPSSRSPQRSPRASREGRPDPADPRRYVPPPQLDSLDESPLVRLSGLGVEPRSAAVRRETSPGYRRARRPGPPRPC